MLGLSTEQFKERKDYTIYTDAYALEHAIIFEIFILKEHIPHVASVSLYLKGPCLSPVRT